MAKFDEKTLSFPDGSAWTRTGGLAARSKVPAKNAKSRGVVGTSALETYNVSFI